MAQECDERLRAAALCGFRQEVGSSAPAVSWPLSASGEACQQACSVGLDSPSLNLL